MNIKDNSKIILGYSVFDKMFLMDKEPIYKYLRILERFGGVYSESFTIEDIGKALKISNKEAIEIIEILKEVRLINVCDDKFGLIDYKNNSQDIVTLNRASLYLILKHYDLSLEDILVAIGLLYINQRSGEKLIGHNYLKNKLLIDDKMFESSIRTLENKNLIRINETLLEDGLIKIVNYEIHF